MLTIINKNFDPRYNLALEEYVLKHIKVNEDFILLWQNEPSIIIGRNQNTLEEINENYVKANGVNVVRRISGGGAVYHDFGNLNYTFITDNHHDNLNNYRKFTQPVIDTLLSLGVPAEFAGRNDVVVEGKKISGNAQSYHKERMFHHGTILFDANLDTVSEILKPHIDKIESKGIKSNRSRVTNIKPYLKKEMTIGEFQEYLLKFVLGTDDIASKTYLLSAEDLKAIEQLRAEKYATWEWNYGESPQFQIQKSRRYAGGNVEFFLQVKDGKITECKIYGDFFGKEEVNQLAEFLKGKLFKEEEIAKALDTQPLDHYFFNITKADLLDCLFH